jgi:ADP-ribosylglycohydrolase
MDQYSLSQRFQGALLGATIGQHPATAPIDLTPCLNWLCHQQQPPSLGDNPMTSGQSQTIENAIALLPLWLYTHESWRERQNRLEQISPTIPQSQCAMLWLYGEAIAQLLRPTSPTANLLPSLQTRWQQQAQRGAPALTQPWHDCLTQIHQWQQQRTPLQQIQTDLTDRPASERAIATALISFVRSPDDWSIALRLANQITDSDPAIGGLLGGLWGAYNGWTRFPIGALVSDRRSVIDPANPIPCTTTTQKLLQIWSGRIPDDPRTPAIVMGPR